MTVCGRAVSTQDCSGGTAVGQRFDSRRHHAISSFAVQFNRTLDEMP
jgi:hypothetical protein